MTDENTTETPPVEDGQAPAAETPTSEAVAETKPTEETTPATEPETKEPDQAAEPETPPTAEPEAPPVRVVPEAKDYKLPEGVPDYVAQMAHDNQMTQEQLDTTLTQFSGILGSSAEAEKTLIQNEGQALVKEWGEKADYNLSIVRRALSQNDPDGSLTKMLEDTGYGNHPAVLKHLLSIGSYMQEGGYLKGSMTRPKGEKTAAEAMFGANHPVEAG